MAFKEGNLAQNMPIPPSKRQRMGLAKNDEAVPVSVMPEQIDMVEDAPGKKLPSASMARAQGALAELALGDAEQPTDVTAYVEALSPEEAARHDIRTRKPTRRPSGGRAHALRGLHALGESDKATREPLAAGVPRSTSGRADTGSLRAKAEVFQEQQAAPDLTEELRPPLPEAPGSEQVAREQRLQAIRGRIADIQRRGARDTYNARIPGLMATYDIGRERQRVAAQEDAAFEERQRIPRQMAREHGELNAMEERGRRESQARVYRGENGEIIGMMNLPQVSANDVMTAINNGALRRLTEDMEADVQTAKLQGKDPLDVLRAYKTQIDAWNQMRNDARRLVEEKGDTDDVATNPELVNLLYREDEPLVPLSVLENPETMAKLDTQLLMRLHEENAKRAAALEKVEAVLRGNESALIEKMSDANAPAEEVVSYVVEGTKTELAEVRKAVEETQASKEAELQVVDHMALDAFDTPGRLLREELSDALGMAASLRNELKGLKKKDEGRRVELNQALQASEGDVTRIKSEIVSWQRSPAYRELMKEGETYLSEKKNALEKDVTDSGRAEEVALLEKSIVALTGQKQFGRASLDMLRGLRARGREIFDGLQQEAKRLQETVFQALLQQRRQDLPEYDITEDLNRAVEAEQGVDITDDLNTAVEAEQGVDITDEANRDQADEDITEDVNQAMRKKAA